MRAGGRLTAVIWLALLLAACGAVEVPPPGPTNRPARVESPDTLVIVGYADHRAITEPLVELIPEATDGSAEVTVRFDSAEPMVIGIEGTVFFLRVVAPDGTTVADRIVSGIDASRETHLLGGDYTVEAYYRTCDGNCGLLDPKQSLCHAFTTLEPGERYELVVAYRPAGSTCAVGPPVGPSEPPSRD